MYSVAVMCQLFMVGLQLQMPTACWLSTRRYWTSSPNTTSTYHSSEATAGTAKLESRSARKLGEEIARRPRQHKPGDRYAQDFVFGTLLIAVLKTIVAG